MCKILLVDDHEVVRSGIRLLLESSPSFYIIGEAASAEDALLFIEQQDKPDFILSDINMSGMDGISLVRIMKKVYPHIKIAILSMIEEIDKVAEAFDAGADGYLSKSTEIQELLFGIMHMYEGNKYVTAFLSVRILDGYRNFVPNRIDRASVADHYGITEREIEVLMLISEGLTNSEIAERIFLSTRTVEGYRQHLMEKTKTKNTADLVRFSFQHMLIQ